MVRLISAMSLMALLAGCGGTQFSNSNAIGARSVLRTATQPVLFASGPIATACRSAGRKDASRARCGCVQAVADRSLSSSDQRKGASFFRDPQKAQDTRQSDNAANERFWKRWKAYSSDAARLCT